jgi:putative redox protein
VSDATEPARQVPQRSEAPPEARRPPNRVIAVWRGEEAFDTSKPGGPVSRVDGNGLTGQGPVDTLLSALATCASIDVVEILKKRRATIRRFEVETIGTRADSTPRRLTHVLLRFYIAGEGIDRENALRAIELSVTKYCSVRDSLDRSIPIEWELQLEP